MRLLYWIGRVITFRKFDYPKGTFLVNPKDKDDIIQIVGYGLRKYQVLEYGPCMGMMDYELKPHFHWPEYIESRYAPLTKHDMFAAFFTLKGSALVRFMVDTMEVK